MIFTDAELADLPDDDGLAFVAFEERLRTETRDKAQDLDGTRLEREYAGHILAFNDVTGLGVPFDGEPPLSNNNFWDWYSVFLQTVDYHTVRIRLAHVRSSGGGVTTAIDLSSNYKAQIHKLLDRVRKVVNQAALTDVKKDAIYGAITALQSQVDRSKTRFDGFLSRFLDLTNTIGESAENLEPAVKLLESVMKVIGHAKADHDIAKLPPPEDARKLPGPRPGQEDSEDPENDVPF